MARCSSCGAVVNTRATRCAVCDAPIAPSGPIGVQISHSSLAALPADELPVAAELGKALAPSILLRKRIGRGGMGIVFLAHDQSLKRDVAIKVLAPDLAGDVTTRARFIREAEAAASVSHPNVVNVYHVGLLPNTEIPYFVMQYVEGPSMAEAAGRMLPEARVRRVIGEVASGLAAAHRRGVIHRDIKPGNIVIEGETGRAMLLDFGIAAAVAVHPTRRSDRLTSEGSYVGTPQYMSPELAAGEEAIDKSDVYSLGVVAYELLTGKPPFPGSGLRVMAAHVNDELPDLHQSRADLSPEIVELVERSLAKDPEQRPSAQSIVDHLLPGSRRGLEWPPPGLSPLRRASAQFRFGLVALVLTAAAFLFAISARPVPPQEASVGARATATFESARNGTATTPSASAATEENALQEREAIWAAAATATFVLLLLATVFVALQALPTLRRVRMARRSGYPWSTVSDVVSDMRRDGGDLMSGLGIYAFCTDRERNRLLISRRLRLVGIIAAACLAVVSMVAWVSGWFISSVATEQMDSSIVPMWLALAPTGLLAVCVALAADEAVLRRRRAQADEQWQGAHLVNKELVSSWVISAGRTFSGSTGLSRVPVEIAAGAVLIVVVASALFIAGAGMRAAIRASAHRAAALSWVTTVSDSGYASAWRNRDAILERATAGLAADSAAFSPAARARFLASFVAPGTGANQLIAREPADTALFIGDSRLIPVAAIDSTLRRLPGSADGSQAFGAAAPEASLAMWRAAAHALPLPLFWPFRDAEAPQAIVVSDGALRTLAAVNLRDGLVGLTRNDFRTAELRARENLAVVRQLLRAGTAQFGHLGDLTTDAAAVLEYIGRSTSNGALVAEAGSIRALGLQRRSVIPHASALFSDPGYLPITRLVGDTLLEPAVRVELAQHAASGFCENPREVLFGPAPSRLVLTGRASENLADLPGASRVVGPWERWLAESIATGITPPAPMLGSGASPSQPNRSIMFATSLFRLHGLRSRLAYCSLG